MLFDEAIEQRRVTEGQSLGDRSRVMFAVSHSSAGGAQEVWVNLAEAFAQRGHDVRVVALYPLRANVRATPPHLPWQYVMTERPGNVAAQVAMLSAVTELIRGERPAIVFTAQPAANATFAVAAQLAGTGTKVVAAHHSPVERYSSGMNLLDGLTGCLPAVSAIVNVSRTVEASLRGKPKGYRAKSEVIPNALPPQIETLTRHLASRRPARVREARTVVATGRLAPEKNYPALIRASRMMPDVRIKIIGDGPEGPALLELARREGVADRVEFLGFRPRAHVLETLSTASLFVQPSLFEGHSLGLLEAARLGIPLVVSSVPAQVEGISLGPMRCGIAVDPHDHHALAAAILGLLDDAARYADYSQRALRLGAASSFSAMVDRYEALLP